MGPNANMDITDDTYGSPTLLSDSDTKNKGRREEKEEKRKKRRKCLNFFIAEKSIAVINCELKDERNDSVRGAFVCFITESLSS